MAGDVDMGNTWRDGRWPGGSLTPLLNVDEDH